jgi:hypothetical protein
VQGARLQPYAQRKHLTVCLHHASRDAKTNFIFAARTARREKGPRQLQRARARTAVLFPQRAE